jgi:uncharacterized protein (UPF0261 family)
MTLERQKMKKQLLIIATLDTKGREAAYVKDCVQGLGIRPILMDVGTLGEPLTHPDITRVEVVGAAGFRFENLVQDIYLKKANSTEYWGWEVEQGQQS